MTVNLFGSFGFGNLGDELVLPCFERMLEHAGLDHRVQAYTRFNDPIMGEAKSHLAAVQGFSAGHQMAFLCGGGIIENRDNSCLNRALEATKTAASNSIIPFAISTDSGQNYSRRNVSKIKSALKRLQSVAVRDSFGANTLKQIVPEKHVRVIGDIGLWTKNDAQLTLDAKKKYGRFVTLILSDIWTDETFIDWVSHEIAHTCDQLNASLLIMPISLFMGGDIRLHDTIARKLSQEAPNLPIHLPYRDMDADDFTPTLMASLIAASDLTVSMRLHGCIVSYSQNTPFVAISYHPKVNGFLETVGCPSLSAFGSTPASQSKHTYGFSFDELDFRRGELVDTVGRALDVNQFPATQYFQTLQIDAIRELLG